MNNKNLKREKSYKSEKDIDIYDVDNIEDVEELTDLELNTDIDSSNDILKKYYKRISEIQPLSIEEEQWLGKKIKSGDKEALKKLVLSNLKFVVSVANKYKHSNIPLSDIINQGNIGLLEAAKRYDYSKGTKFITYAVWWIKQAIVQGITEQTGNIKLPVKQASNLYKINIAKSELFKKLGYEPSIEEIAAAVNMNKNDIQDLIAASTSNISLDSAIKNDNNQSFVEILESSLNIEEEVILKTLKNSVDEIVADLTPRESDIIMQRFGLDNGEPKTLEEIGEKLNISRERVRQIESVALNKLKKKALKKKLNDYLN